MRVVAAVTALGMASSCSFHRKKYENPISKDTQQPDKVLYDKAVNDIERGRYEVARITLNTLINTYDTSEFMAKAKLAVADSWYREGGSHGLAQAEAEYKDFILFYPTMEEAAESQYKICQIHYKQMEKPDRDTTQALRAEAECRQLLVQFPNSKFAPGAEQTLRNIQEVLAEAEMRVGRFYHAKGSHPAAANRLNGMVDHYPLYSAADEALWVQGDSYSRMGNRFRTKAGESFARIVREYPLSPYVDQAKQRLKEMELPIPEADPVALNRMKYELENQQKPGMMDHALGIFKRGPDTKLAAKSGTPTMDAGRPAIPASIPVPAGEAGFQGDVTASTVTDSTALDTKPDARTAVPAQPAQQADTASPTPGNAAQAQQLPTNRQGKPPKQKKPKKGQPAPPAAPAEQTAPAVPAPAPTDSGAANLAPQK